MFHSISVAPPPLSVSAMLLNAIGDAMDEQPTWLITTQECRWRWMTAMIVPTSRSLRLTTMCGGGWSQAWHEHHSDAKAPPTSLSPHIIPSLLTSSSQLTPAPPTPRLHPPSVLDMPVMLSLPPPPPLNDDGAEEEGSGGRVLDGGLGQTVHGGRWFFTPPASRLLVIGCGSMHTRNRLPSPVICG
jgi:hypothetical protein